MEMDTKSFEFEPKTRRLLIVNEYLQQILAPGTKTIPTMQGVPL